jgi:MATE family multidrug resistance protein
MLYDKEDETLLISDQQKEQELNKEHELITIKESIVKITEIALPTILYLFCLIFKFTINLMFISRFYTGKENEEATGAVGISGLYINCLMLSVIHGLLSGFDTLGSNAYGSKKFRLLGIYYHRAQLVAYCVVIVSLVIHFFAGPYLLGLTTNSENVRRYIKEYFRVAMFYVFFEVAAGSNYRFINIIGKPLVNFIPVLASLALHPLWCYLFIFVFNLGLIGAGLALILSHLLIAIYGTIYINFMQPIPEAVFWLNRHSFTGWWSYLKFSLPSCLLTCSGWWGSEILAIIAVFISEQDYYAHILCANILTNCNAVSLSFGFATTILIGAYMGKGDIKSCKIIRNTALIYGICFMFLISVLVFFLKDQLISIFNVSEPALPLLLKLMNIFAIFILFELTQIIMGGILKGYGKQFLASIVALPNYYLLQISVAYLLGIYFKLGVTGIWYAMLICAITMATIFSIIIFVILDLKQILLETSQRIKNDQLELSESNTELNI